MDGLDTPAPTPVPQFGTASGSITNSTTFKCPVVVGTSTPACLYGLSALVRDAQGLVLGGAACLLEDFLRSCAQTNQGVALVDPLICLEGTRALLAHLRLRAPDMRVLLITDCAASHLVRNALQEGAAGLVHKEDALEEIRVAIAAVAAGHRHVSPTAARYLADSFATAPLTAREMEVLLLLSLGRVNKVIARELGIGVGTVKSHVSAVLAKLGGCSRTDAVIRARRLGLINL
jgi:DNA-binding NarL/FixJ family response regulator